MGTLFHRQHEVSSSYGLKPINDKRGKTPKHANLVNMSAFDVPINWRA